MSVPLVKLGYLLVKTLSKPISKIIKEQAKSRPSFRKGCAYLAQSYHRMEVRLRQSSHDNVVSSTNSSEPTINPNASSSTTTSNNNHSKSPHSSPRQRITTILRPVRPLDEEKAVELGANFIAEFFIFSVAGMLVLVDSIRSKAQTDKKLSDESAAIESKFEDLSKRTELLEAKLLKLEDESNKR